MNQRLENEQSQSNLSPDSRANAKTRLFITALILALTIAVLYILSRNNYPLFHSIVDMATVFIASGVFVVVWTRRRLLDNHYYLFVGIAFLFFGFLDFLHLLGNKNMGVFPEYGNLGPTLYIASRYVLGISMVIAPLFIKRKINVSLTFAVYSIVVILLMLSIFYWQNFPATYIEGVGLTGFKVISDYVICFLLLGAIGLLWVRRQALDPKVFRVIIYSLIFSILTGLTFTAYTDPFGLNNAIGHFFQIASFYLVYNAFINTIMIKPQDILYRNLQQSKVEVTKLNSDLKNVNLELKQDIVEREQTEKALKESERKLIGVLESMPDAFVSFDTNLRYTYVNANAERLQAMRREELLGKDVRIIYPDAESYKTISQYEQVIREQKPLTSTSYHAGFDRWVEIMAFPTPDGVSVFYKDVSAPVKALQALRESEEKYRNLFNNMAEEVHFWKLERDQDGQIKTWRLVDANPPTLKTWGKPTVEDMRGKTTDEIFGSGSTEHYLPVVRKVMAEGIPFSYEDYFPNLNKYFRFTTVPLGDYFITTGADITRIKQAEESLRHYTVELENANKELESFSYTVSHDLRAPLRSLNGYSSALLEDYSEVLDEQGKKWLGNIRISSLYMGQLIDDILGLSRVIRAELKIEKVNLSEIAETQADKLKEAEPERKVDFVIAPDVRAVGDKNLLGLVLQNLLGNAFKFTSKSPSARIEFGLDKQNGDPVYFVRDNGTGFDMQYVDKLFKPFQRLHSDQEYPGTGIGLATVQRVIQRHGGRIRAEGEIGKGAAFYFTLGEERN
jgi:PAS domain S-box-containing protein